MTLGEPAAAPLAALPLPRHAALSPAACSPAYLPISPHISPYLARRLLTGILGCLANLSALLLPPLIHLRLRGRRPASAARPAAVRTALAATDALLLLAGFASCAGPALLIVQQLARRAGEEGPEGLPPALGE